MNSLCLFYIFDHFISSVCINKHTFSHSTFKMNNTFPSSIASDVHRTSLVADYARFGNVHINNLTGSGLIGAIASFVGTPNSGILTNEVFRLSSGLELNYITNVGGEEFSENDIVAVFPASTKEVRMVFVWKPNDNTVRHITFQVWKRVKNTSNVVSWIVAGESTPFDSSSELDAYTLSAIFEKPIVANTPIRITLQQQSGETPATVTWGKFQGKFYAVF